MIIGIPVWVGRKLHAHYRLANKHKRNTAITAGVMASVRTKNEGSNSPPANRVPPVVKWDPRR